jgi:hypothetical protein
MKQVRPGVPIMMLSAQERIPAEALEEVDAFVSKAQAPLEFVAAVHELVATDPPFFARWLQDWKQRSRAA